MAAWSGAAALFGVVGFGGVTWRTPWRRMLEAYAVSLLFTAAIVPLAAVVLRKLTPLVRHRFSPPIRWTILIAGMIFIGTIGSLVAIGLLTAVGYVSPADAIRTWATGSLKVSVILTVVFGISANAFEAMRSQLHETTVALRTKERDEAEARRVAAEAQLVSLESRVNPHFLFNTLNSIASLTHSDPVRAERMTTQLASLMRSSLDSGSSPLVTADEEARLVRTYLDIERVRFGDRLRFTIDIDDRARQTSVPRLSLQTVVENSVKYAIAPRREGGRVTIRGVVADDVARFSVEDDGPGFDAKHVPDGHGLSLLTSRLAMIFEQRAALHIESRAGRTCVTIEVPRSG
jgi:LytS/YehU family sensor histidine kinase